MLELTESARKELESYFADKDKSDIRIYMTSGGCCGPRLALALDDAAEEDCKEEQAGFTFCINKLLLAKVQGVKIDVSEMGFSVEPTLPFPESAGGECGGCCGGCGG